MNETKRIPCERVLPRLWEYIDGELTPERREEIRAHLEVCSRCFPQYDFRRAFRTFLRRQATQPVPTNLRRRIFERLLEEEARAS